MRKTITILLVVITLLAVSCDMMMDDTNHNPWIHVREDDTGEEYDVQSPYYEIQYDVEYHIGDVGPCGGIIIYDVDADNVYEDRREGETTWVDAMPGPDCLVSGICGYRYVEAMPYDLTTVETRVAYVEGDHTTGVLKLIDDCNNANTLGTNDWRVPMTHEIYAFFELVWNSYFEGDTTYYDTTSKDAGLGWYTNPNTGKTTPYLIAGQDAKCNYWVNTWAYQTGAPETVVMGGRPNFHLHNIWGCNTAVTAYYNLRLVRSF